MAVTRYNAKDTTIMVNDVVITGLGEDMISIEKEEAYFEPIVGAQGDVIKSEINNNLYNVTITVQPTSPQLSFLLNLQGQSETFPVWIINKALGIRAGGTNASVMEAPEISLGAEAEDLEFTFCILDGVVEGTN